MRNAVEAAPSPSQAGRVESPPGPRTVGCGWHRSLETNLKIRIDPKTFILLVQQSQRKTTEEPRIGCTMSDRRAHTQWSLQRGRSKVRPPRPCGRPHSDSRERGAPPGALPLQGTHTEHTAWLTEGVSVVCPQRSGQTRVCMFSRVRVLQRRAWERR